MSSANDQTPLIPKVETGQNSDKKDDTSKDNLASATQVSCDLLKQTFFEFAGTFMFILIIYFSKGDVTKFAFGFWVLLSVFGKFSGAHVNPAITFGFYIYEGDICSGIPKLILYWLAQFGGALFGAMMARRLIPDIVYVGVPTNQSLWDIMYSEFFFTGTFLFVILWVCSKVTSPSKIGPINCAIIVGWFYMIVNAGAQLSGAAYNPAILTILNVYAYQHKDDKAIKYLFSMIGAELAGVLVFAILFKVFFENYYEGKYLPGKQPAKANEEVKAREKEELKVENK